MIPQVQTRCRLPVRPGTVRVVPRKPRRNRNIRVEDSLWDDVLKIAERRDEVLSEVIRAKLAEYRDENRHLLEDAAT